MATPKGRRSRVPRLTPLASCLGLVLAAGAGMMPASGHAAARTGRQPLPLDGMPAIPLETRFAPGDPRGALIDEALSRVPPDRPAGSIVVTNCNDSGAGSLRDAMSNAVSGDTIDMSALACSTITLTSGPLITSLDDLTIIGSGMNSLTIDADHGQPGLVHLGAGDLDIQSLTVLNGGKYATGTNNAPGGCIYSQGNVSLTDAGAKYCVAQTSGSGQALGGGIYAKGDITLFSSVVSGNSAVGAGTNSFGGGVFTQTGAIASKYTIFRNNSVYGTSGGYGYGGAIWSGGDATIVDTSVFSNTADAVAGIDIVGFAATQALSIGNTTITDNDSLASYFGSGVYLGHDATVANSTITGNFEHNPANAKYGAGVTAFSAATVDLQSSIVSGNSLDNGSGNLPSDIGSVLGDATLTGASNLLGYSLLDAPGDTIFTIEPMLGSLTSANGGATPTMAPLPGSPAINHGNNAGGAKYDQRGVGYPRVVGSSADIGAVESDAIFIDGFDGTAS